MKGLALAELLVLRRKEIPKGTDKEGRAKKEPPDSGASLTGNLTESERKV